MRRWKGGWGKIAAPLWDTLSWRGACNVGWGGGAIGAQMGGGARRGVLRRGGRRPGRRVGRGREGWVGGRTVGGRGGGHMTGRAASRGGRSGCPPPSLARLQMQPGPGGSGCIRCCSAAGGGGGGRRCSALGCTMGVRRWLLALLLLWLALSPGSGGGWLPCMTRTDRPAGKPRREAAALVARRRSVWGGGRAAGEGNSRALSLLLRRALLARPFPSLPSPGRTAVPGGGQRDGWLAGGRAGFESEGRAAFGLAGRQRCPAVHAAPLGGRAGRCRLGKPG